MGFVLMDFAGDNEYQGQELIDLIIYNCLETSSVVQDAIGEVKNERMKSEKSQEEVYDLSGRKLNSSFFTLHSSHVKNGLYIIDGQKKVLQ